jgi:hypothetical protein
MDSALWPPRDLSVLAPSREPDEALSSWLVRTANAHLLTIPELEREIGGTVAGLDRGDATLIPRLSTMMRVDVAALSAMVPADLLAHPMRPGPSPPYAWSICRRCLEEDQVQGRAPYIRQAWTHPLSAFCRAHNSPLVPHGNSEIKIASDLTLFGDGVEPREPVDNLLGVVAFDDERMVARVFQVLDGTASIGRLEDRLSLRWAVRDIIDALATNMRAVGTGSLAAVLEQPLFQRKSLQGSNYLQMDWWSDIDAATRLLYVRFALAILADPGDPVRNPKTSPLGPHWLTLRYRHSKIQGWQSVFTHAVPDLLFLLVMELPRHAVQELNERSMAWPPDLRRRWIYAVAVGAVGGFVW